MAGENAPPGGTNDQQSDPSLKQAPGSPSDLDRLIDALHLRADRLTGVNLLSSLVDAVPDKADDKAKVALDGSPEAVIALLQGALADLDKQIYEKLDAILHDEAFQKLEATWRGLYHLVFNTNTSTRLKLRVLDATRKELSDDLAKSVDVQQSALFKRVYEEEYGTLGGKPYGLLVGDFAFDNTAPSLTLLGHLAEVAAAAHAPFIGAASPALFDLASFADLPKPRDLSKIFESINFAGWRSLRQREESRYVTLTLPRVLMRLPYEPANNPVEGMDYREYTRQAATGDVATDRSDPANEKYLWGNPAWFLAQRITKAFELYAWTAAIRGVEGGGKVENLPISTFLTRAGETGFIIPTEVAITDRREKELSDLGFISLVYCKGENYAAFFGAQTINKPVQYYTASATSNAELSARLPYILNTSRFAHYIKVMMRERIGTFMTKENVQSYLTSWISNFVLDKDDAGQDLKAQYPLREARIDVTDVPGKPGAYNATVFLRPHFQLEGLSASLRLVAQLPPPLAA